MPTPRSEREPRGERERQPLTQRLPDSCPAIGPPDVLQVTAPPDCHEGVLQDVLGEARIAQDPPSDPEEESLTWWHQACNRSAVGSPERHRNASELAERCPEAFPTVRRLAERPGLDDNDQPGLAVAASRAAKWSGRDDDRLEDTLGGAKVSGGRFLIRH